MPDIITIVSPWFGADTIGGAETQVRQLANAIRATGTPVEVWASNGRDSFSPPVPYYPSGADELDGVPVRRFAITAPRAEPYVPAAVARRALMHKLPEFPEHELKLLASLVSSEELLEAVANEQHGRRFLFVPYPFPTSFWGTVLAGERAYLLPCLHDEPYARYNTVRWMFHHAQRSLANSPAERRLALRLYDLPEERVVVAGEGIDLAPVGDGAAFRQQHGFDGPLLLYVGRRDATKNIPLLLSYFREYWALRGPVCRLLLAGRDPLDLPPALTAVVHDLGYIDSQAKYDAYAAADIFVQPSVQESFSIVLMEAWLQGAAALVNADCEVTHDAVQASGGGASFASFAEFVAVLDLLLANTELRRDLGHRGQQWVRETCRWDLVAQHTIAAMRE